jgi:predicted transcriptional regulator
MMLSVARYVMIFLGVVIGIPYGLALIGMARIADRIGQRTHRLRYSA